jgi:hypothetical protein
MERTKVIFLRQVNSGIRPTVKWLKDGTKIRESSQLRVMRNNNTLSIQRAQVERSLSHSFSFVSRP